MHEMKIQRKQTRKIERKKGWEQAYTTARAKAKNATQAEQIEIVINAARRDRTEQNDKI